MALARNPGGGLETTTAENQASLQNIHTQPQTNALSKAESMIFDIARYFAKYLHKLPTEVVRLYSAQHGGDFLAYLDLLLRDHVLDSFLEEHPKCLQMIQELFGSRHSYLAQPDLKDEDGTCNATAIRRRNPEETWSPQGGPFAEAFKPGKLARSNLTNEGRDVLWELSYSTHPTADSEMAIPANILYDCIDAYNNFEPISAVKTLSASGPGKLTLTELEQAEIMYHLVNPAQLCNLTRDELIKRIPNLTQRTKNLLKNPRTSDAQVVEEIRKFLVGSLIASQDQMKAEIELVLEFECPPPESEDVIMKDTAKSAAAESRLVLAPRGYNTAHDSELHSYKGWNIEGPKTQLLRAKNFLADEDADRTIDWERKFAELTEYFSHLHNIFTGEDWGLDLKEAVGMLRTHWIFENYHYGEPLLIVDFPKNVWPTQSKRLPRLPGPDIVVRPESNDQRDLTGPRHLLHTKVTSAHDQQYEMPVDVLKACYLKAYWNDATRFWANGGQAKVGERLNLVRHENVHFEECIRQGMVHTAKFLANEGRFQYSPAGIQIGPSGTKRATRESLQAFARFRGGKRAALQQCLNIFTHSENRKMCTPWRTLTLPAPKPTKKRDTGIVYSSMMLKNPPKKESRDPWAYTRAYQWYKKEEMRWAQWSREHAIKDLYTHRLSLRSEEPEMQMPKNWTGPVLGDLMDLDMKSTYELLRRCQVIHQGLKRSLKRAPREFINNVMKMVDAGLKGKTWSKLSLSFGNHEFLSTDKKKLANIRPTEAAWLEYVCQPSRNYPGDLEEPLDKHGEVMLSRVIELMKDISPMALFKDRKPQTMDEFLDQLNLVCRGPVKRHRFNREDVVRLAPKLHTLKVIKVYRGEGGELQLGRPDMEFHPEDLVTWPRPESGQWEPTGNQNHLTVNVRDDASVSSRGAISIQATVLPSLEDFHEYPESIPRRKDVRSLREYVKNPVKNPGDAEKTKNFFYCLGYRLGISLNAFKELHEKGQEKLRDPARQERNRDSLEKTISFWLEDVKTRPNDPKKNPQKKGNWRETLIYPDVVNIADPDTYKQHKEEWTKSEWPDTSLARQLVRENLIREVYENKTMLWPLPLPYNSYAQKYKVADPKIERQKLEKRAMARRNAREDGGRNAALVSEEEEEEEGEQQQETRTMRREPIWAFGHPSRKKAAHQFWSMNNWPVHLQSKDRQESIRSRGPQRRQTEATAEATAKGNVYMPHGLPDREEEYEIPFWKKAQEREQFIPGSDEYWLGDTPYQRKVFEHRIRRRLERPRKRRWYERLWGNTTRGNKPVTDADIKLPDVDPDMIPESRPYKRQRTSGLSVFIDENDIAEPLIPPGTRIPKAERDTITPSRMGMRIGNKSLTAEQAISTLNLAVDAEVPERPLITYYIPPTPTAQGQRDPETPMIVYHTPSKHGSTGN